MSKFITYETGIEIYEQCEQIVRSYGPPIEDSTRKGLINCIQHFKMLYIKDYKSIDKS